MAESEPTPPTEKLLPVMEESEPTPPTKKVQTEVKKLKHLDFIQSAVIYVVVCSSSIYEYAKENSGPLKPGVQTVEGTVRAVLGPVYDKFHNVPFKLLKFVDRKVDETITEVDRHVPSLIKQASSQARAVASDVKQVGVVDAATNIVKKVYTKYELTSKDYYSKYEPVAEQYAVSAWKLLNRLPLFPQVAHIVVPTAAYWSEKYNRAVAYSAGKGYKVAYCMPKVPVERIAKVFKGTENGLSNG